MVCALGGYDAACAALTTDPADFDVRLLPSDLPCFQPIMAGATPAASRPWPRRGSAASSTNRQGFTPDNEFILGESEVGGFFVAAGFSADGVAGAGRIDWIMATWTTPRANQSRPLEDRTSDASAGLPVVPIHAARAIENYVTYYDIHYPNEERQAAGHCGMCQRTRRWAASARPSARKSGWGVPELVRARRRRPAGRGRGGSRALAPARLAGKGRRRPPSRRRRWPPARPVAQVFQPQSCFPKLQRDGVGMPWTRCNTSPGTTRIVRSARSCTCSCSTGAGASRRTSTALRLGDNSGSCS